MADWVTISQVATAGGTLVLAVATFGSIRSAKRSTDLAERSLRAGMRPLLVPSRDGDAPERVRFGDNKVVTVEGHGGVLEVDGSSANVYLALALRNGGAGLAVVHGWGIALHEMAARDIDIPDVGRFRRQLRDIYVPAGDTGFWQGAIRLREDPDYDGLVECSRTRGRLAIDLLYGDQDGGQRTITRFGLTLDDDDEEEGGASGQRRAEVLRVWALDGDDSRTFNDLPDRDDGVRRQDGSRPAQN